MTMMKGITLKFPEETLRRLQRQARQTGRSVAALVRERVEDVRDGNAASVHAVSADLAGSIGGRRRSATNKRRKFRRS